MSSSTDTNDIMTLDASSTQVLMSEVENTSSIFEDGEIKTARLPGKLNKFQYVCWGDDDKRPYEIMRLIGQDEVMSQNKHFNILTCYGSGLVYRDLITQKKTTNKDIKSFLLHNSMNVYYLEQCTDMKWFMFTVTVVILSLDGKSIVEVRHKDACNCRFELAKAGKIDHVFYANFEQPLTEDNVQVIPLLDERNPIGDLLIRTGQAPGKKGRNAKDDGVRKYAIVSKFPMPGNPYYPSPYYTAIFRSDWYTIKQLIARSKKAKIMNNSGIKYHVQIHHEYWDKLCDAEMITDPTKRKERITLEKQNIKNFIAGIDNSGKMWITGFYSNPVTGEPIQMVKIDNIDPTKDGGDWSSEFQEATNNICFVDGVHANLVGAVPGKSQSNNSGSDKRELFTLKQSLEIAYHHVMESPHWVVIEYNGWLDSVEPDVPMITLTTLDKHSDAKKTSSNPDSEPKDV